ncbi:MAG: SNF2-related protein [Methylomonas sp.]|jgi:superfamily II DNA or RNA helicase
MTKLGETFDTEAIRYECSTANLQRGIQYFEEKRLLEFNIAEEQDKRAVLHSRVKGSHHNTYKQTIIITWREDLQTINISGQCTCPMGYNCKHVAAACLEYHKRLQATTAPVTANACFDWLESLDEESHKEHADPEEFLTYVLKPNSVTQEIIVDVLISKIKRNGSHTKGRELNINNLRYTFNYNYKTPSYLQDHDTEIIKLLLSASGNGYMLHIKGWSGAYALEKMLESGRLYWETQANPPLSRAAPRLLDCKWLRDEQGDYKLSVQTCPPAFLIPTEPAYFIDTGLQQLGVIDSPHINSKQLRKLLTAPTVPAPLAQQFSQRLVIDYPHIKLPTPANYTIQEVSGQSIQPHLTLQAAAYDKAKFFHQLQLDFIYDAYRVSAGRAEAFTMLNTQHGYVRVQRTPEVEQRFIDVLYSLGFEMADDITRTHLLFYSPEKNLSDNAQRWYAFIHEIVPDLKDQGWLIEIDQGFQMDFQDVDYWDAEIAETGQNWFEMRFHVDVNGQQVPLLPLLMPVLEQYAPDDLPDMLTLPLSRYQYLTLKSAKLKPFLKIIYEIFNTVGAGRLDNLKLSRYDAASLAQLETHSYGLFSIKGGEQLRAIGRKLLDFEGIAEVPVPKQLNAELRKYQLQGLNWLQFIREYQFGGILADDMGLGKTLQTLCHLLVEKLSGRMTAPCLIVAPTSLMSNWRREAARFTPDLKLLILQGSDRKSLFEKIPGYDLILTTYPLLSRDEEFLLAQSYYYLILDEAQIVKNPQAKAAKIVRAAKTQHRLCLTGTPMENHLGELWTQFDFLMPGFLGDSSDFKRRYRTPIELHGDAEQRQRLSKRIKPFMLRRTKQAVVEELPLKTEIVRAVALGAKQAMLYESIRLSMEQKIRRVIAEKGLARSHITILDALLKLRQTCCDPRILPLSEAQKLHESAKLELLMEMLPELLEEGRRILVFSQFTRMISLIERELQTLKIAYSKLTGQTHRRDDAIQQFKSGAADVFLISLKAGGVGLNLTEADTVIVYDPWWNPAVENQAADRAHRIGQEKPVFVYKLITENTVEEKIIALQERKQALADGVYAGGKNQSGPQFTAEDLRELFEPLSD